jgi:DNA end-binding protein Ku
VELEFSMAPRANWKGYLKLSLVSCPIALYPASSSAERVSFRQINKKTGNRLRQQLVDDETREPVPAEDKGRGYEVGKDEFIPIEDDELEAIQIESTHTIEIDSFVPNAQIDKRYYDSPYYIAPTDAVGQEAFAVIREAMRVKDMVALGRVVISKRERVIALEPYEKGLLGTTLRYPYEVREASGYFEDIVDIKIPADMRKLAEHILDSKAADFDPSKFVDRYEVALVDLLSQKQAGVQPKKSKAQCPIGASSISWTRYDGASKKRHRAKPPLASPQRAGNHRHASAPDFLYYLDTGLTNRTGLPLPSRQAWASGSLTRSADRVAKRNREAPGVFGVST